MAKTLFSFLLMIALMVGGITSATGLISSTNFLSRHAPSTSADHSIRFKTLHGLGDAGDQINIQFAPGFNLSTLTVADIDFSSGSVTGEENSQPVSSSPSATEWGVTFSGQNITLTHPTNSANGDIDPDDFIVIKIGTIAGGINQIINPAIEGSAIIRFTTSLGESGALAVPITQDQVGVYAGIAGNIQAVIKWAVPQGRIGAFETNDDSKFYLTVRTEQDNDNIILYTQPTLLTTNEDGTYLTPISLGTLIPGDYDVGIKTQQHLTKILQNINLVDGVNNLNFSNPTNGALKGFDVLIAGDIDGLGIDNTNLGDDVVNSIDLSKMLINIDDEDITGNVIRANLNQDVVVNSVDLSMLINNLDAEGDN